MLNSYYFPFPLIFYFRINYFFVVLKFSSFSLLSLSTLLELLMAEIVLFKLDKSGLWWLELVLLWHGQLQLTCGEFVIDEAGEAWE